MRRKTFTLVIEDNYVNLRIVASLTIKKNKNEQRQKVYYDEKSVNNFS